MFQHLLEMIYLDLCWVTFTYSPCGTVFHLVSHSLSVASFPVCFSTEKAACSLALLSQSVLGCPPFSVSLVYMRGNFSAVDVEWRWALYLLVYWLSFCIGLCLFVTTSFALCKYPVNICTKNESVHITPQSDFTNLHFHQFTQAFLFLTFLPAPGCETH